MFETHKKRGREIIGHLSYLLLSEDTLAATHRVREAGPVGAPKPRLLDRVRETVRARHYSRRTEKAYVHWIRRYIFFHGKRHPAEMGAAEVTSFLTSLAVRDKVAASTQNQALNALLFLYREVLGVELPWLDDVVRAKRPQHLPAVLTRDEVRAVLQRLDGGATAEPDPDTRRQGAQGSGDDAAGLGQVRAERPQRARARETPGRCP